VSRDGAGGTCTGVASAPGQIGTDRQTPVCSAGERYGSDLEQINQCALHVTSAHADALIRRYRLQCVDDIKVLPLGEVAESINELK
jgi:hypothetical protein